MYLIILPFETKNFAILLRFLDKNFICGLQDFKPVAADPFMSVEPLGRVLSIISYVLALSYTLTVFINQ